VCEIPQVAIIYLLFSKSEIHGNKGPCKVVVEHRSNFGNALKLGLYMITVSLTRGRFYNAQHQNPAVLHPHFSSETAITFIISHYGLPQHLRACKSLNVILCT